MKPPAELLRRINEKYPWPEARPAAEPVPWSMDYGGRELITDLFPSRQLSVVIELGSFVGGSARQWLEAGPQVAVICIDPWPDSVGRTPFVETHPVGGRFRRQFHEPDGLYHSFLSTMWDVQDRVVAVRGGAMKKLPELRALGVVPDLIYIDTDKTGSEIALCDELFPEALIAGDDWNWSDGHGFPVREPARESARKRHRTLKTYWNTWLIDDRPWTIRERLNRLRLSPRSILQVCRALILRSKGQDSCGTPRHG